ncbi:peroxidase mlt-7-like [Branchiostoma floridae x Branchiostoma japonicum]
MQCHWSHLLCNEIYFYYFCFFIELKLKHSFSYTINVINLHVGPDSIVRGLAGTPHEKFDRFVVSGLTKNLFAAPAGSLGLDLAALNIQRGRDHGLPGYNAWRVLCGLPRARSFDDLATEIPDASTRAKLADLYSHVDDIDLFAAGLAERSVPGGLLGPTFTCLIGRQFRELRKGDRFWFENQGQFSQRQLGEVRKVTLARVLCDNTDDTSSMQRHVFELPGPGNQRVSCTSIPQMDLSAWRESATVVGQVRDFFTDYFGGLRG